MDALVELCRTGRFGPLALGMSAAEVESQLGPPDSVDFIHGEPSRQRHQYRSLRLTLIARPGEELDKDRLRLASVQVRLTRPLLLPEQLQQGLSYDWIEPIRDDVAQRLTANDVHFEVESGFTDVPENQNLIVRHARGGNVMIRVFAGTVRSIDAFSG
jgi:hypothetical protein